MRECVTMLDTIDAYWDERSPSYSETIQRELTTEVYHHWWSVLADTIPGFGKHSLRVLDIGCGPGFFSILCAQAGCSVDALDCSAEMLTHARQNLFHAGINTTDNAQVRLHQGDARFLPFDDGVFDVIVTRNVTWNLEDPLGAYREWQRVLIPGGRLINFDAGWYSYLSDIGVEAQRVIDQANNQLLDLPAACRATDDQCTRCERIAARLPLTRKSRPAWDDRTLRQLGFSQVQVHRDIHKRVWTPNEAAYYASSPLFMIVGVK